MNENNQIKRKAGFRLPFFVLENLSRSDRLAPDQSTLFDETIRCCFRWITRNQCDRWRSDGLVEDGQCRWCDEATRSNPVRIAMRFRRDDDGIAFLNIRQTIEVETFCKTSVSGECVIAFPG